MPPFQRREQSLLANLFSIPRSRQVPGLIVVPDAFTAGEEEALLSYVDASPAAWTKRRTRLTKNYGPYYTYVERDTPEGRFRYTDGVIKHTELPPFLYDTVLPIVRRAIPSLLQTFEPNQLHVALYNTEDDGKIHMHNDNKMGQLGPYIVGMSLVSGCHMTFVRPKDGKKRIVSLPRRCVYVLSEEAHFEWRHGILTGQTQGKARVSFTLRDVRRLAVEDQGGHVKKSSHKPTKQHIEAQKQKDALKQNLLLSQQSSNPDAHLTVQSPQNSIKLVELLDMHHQGCNVSSGSGLAVA